MAKISRRDFLGTAAVGSLGFSLFGPAFITQRTADLAVVKGANPAAATRAAVEAVGGIKRFLKPGGKVMIKPNISWDRVPTQAATTNPEVVGSVVAMCKEAGAGSIVVMDNSLNDPRRCYIRSGISAAATAAGGEAPFMNPRRFELVDTGGKALGKWEVYKDALEVDLLINVPVAKHHSAARLSIGMKNLYGLIGGARSRLHQSMDQGIADLAAFFKPQLTIVDAYRILVRNGPQGGRISDTRLENTIIASADLVAADSRAVMLFGLKGTDIGYIRMAADMGVGTYDLSSITVKEFAI